MSPIASDVAAQSFNRRALFTFNALPRVEQKQVLDTLASFLTKPQQWLASNACKFDRDQPTYLVGVNDTLRAIVEVRESRPPLVLDLVRHDTLATFGAFQDAQ